MFHQQALRRMSRGEIDETYINPVLPGFNPDPSIIRVKKDYFLTTSSFEYFPGAPIYHSLDLIQWTLIGHALTRKSQLDIRAPEPGGGVWASTLRYHEDCFYLTTCVWDRYRPQDDGDYKRAWPQGFYVKTKDIWDSDSWSEPVYFDQPGFDQDLFWDVDGKVYLSTTHRKSEFDSSLGLKQLGVHVCTVDLETGNSTSESILIRESPSGVAEGSHLFKRGKYYYLFTAEGGTESGHSECCYRNENSPLGPWEACPGNPLLRNTTENEVQNTGHCDFFEAEDGRWWAVCLAVRPQKISNGWSPSVLGRETFLVPVAWEQDWPVLNCGRPISSKSVAAGLYVYDQPVKWHESFVSPNLQLGWYRKNTPVKPQSDISLTDRPGYLRMYGGPHPLDSPACPTALFRKQLHKQGVWRTRLSFRPGKTGSQAGTVVYWNYLLWASIGVQGNAEGEQQIIFTDAQGTIAREALAQSTSEVILVVECKLDTYRLGFAEAWENSKAGSSGEALQWIGKVNTKDITRNPALGNPFTGMMLGLFACGDMQRSLVPADFAYAEFM